MKIVELTKAWLPAAARLVEENYEEECQAVPALPKEVKLPSLETLAANGLGVAAVEGEELLGFLGAYGPWEPVFCTQDVRGVFSPIHAHGARREKRTLIYQRMYQAAAEKWVKAGASSHAISLYAHDAQAKDAFYPYGFGMRCMDLIRDLSEPEGQNNAQCEYFELPSDCQQALRPLRRALSDYLAQSPSFMCQTEADLQAWIIRREKNPPRTFVAVRDGRIIAYIEVTERGENFAVNGPETRNICGAYCLPDCRGENVARGLLCHIIRTLKSEGFSRLGVDCESFNPTALHFWSKYFTPYTNSVVRRIDENTILFTK